MGERIKCPNCGDVDFHVEYQEAQSEKRFLWIKSPAIVAHNRMTCLSCNRTLVRLGGIRKVGALLYEEVGQ